MGKNGRVGDAETRQQWRFQEKTKEEDDVRIDAATEKNANHPACGFILRGRDKKKGAAMLLLRRNE